MIDDKDVKKIVGAFKDIFPTAEMVQKGFLGTDKKVALGFEKVDKHFESMDKRLDRIENSLIKKHSDEIVYIRERLKKLEEALAIE